MERSSPPMGLGRSGLSCDTEMMRRWLADRGMGAGWTRKTLLVFVA